MLMKTLFLLFCVLLFSFLTRAQSGFLPGECEKLLDDRYPTWRYDNDWDYENTRRSAAAYAADFNGDGKKDYGVFIEVAGQKKLVLFIRSARRYRLYAVRRDAVFAADPALMSEVRTFQRNMETKFFENLPEGFSVPKDSFGLRILKEYGALFVARGGAVVPKGVAFRDEREVAEFQSSLSVSRHPVGRFEIELQTAAMDALKNALAEAANKNLKITTRDYDAGRRSYGETVGLWLSRVEPALEYWTTNGKIAPPVADRLRSVSLAEQIPEIFSLEEQGIFFSRDLSKPIMYSVAPPGTSQHLSMLAVDINEYDSPEIRKIMARNGWHQTVVSDLPHFTYLGAREPELPALGLKKVISGGRFYWVPSL